MSIRTKDGCRKYVNQPERQLLLEKSKKLCSTKKLFVQMFIWTGARISEVLELRCSNVDFYERVVIIRTLKRRKFHQRVLPLPEAYLRELLEYMDDLQLASAKTNPILFSWSRRTGTRYIDNLMNMSSIRGKQACSRGLRHGYAVNCVLKGIPLSLLKDWMGHSNITTTEIYTQIVGPEIRKLAAKTW